MLLGRGSNIIDASSAETAFLYWFGLFLVACTRHSVGQSVGPSVHPLVPLVQKQAESVQKGCFSAGGISNAPAQKHATDDTVYTALLSRNDRLVFQGHPI